MKILIATVLAAVAFVAGDWFGLFRNQVTQTPDFIHITFETRDAASHKVVPEVHVVCTRPSARSVCSERLTGIPGQTEITFGVFRNDRRSYLFSEEIGFTLGRTGEMSMTFIHPNYDRQTMFINNKVLRNDRNQKIIVELAKADAE